MIPRLNRLPHTRLTQALSFSSRHLILKVVPNKLSYSRFAFVVGKKIDKRSVVRNRFKRLLREIFFSLTQSSTIGMDMVCIVKKSFYETSYDDLRSEVKELINKAIQV